MQLGKRSTTDHRKPLENALDRNETISATTILSVKVLLTANEVEKYSCHIMPNAPNTVNKLLVDERENLKNRIANKFV